MAAALIPLVAGLAPSLIQLIASLVHPAAQAAEVLGPGTGAVKFGQVFATVITLLQKAAAAGTIPKELPSDEIIKTIIQSVVSAMQLDGVLGGPASPPAVPVTVPAGSAAQQALVLRPGQSVVISVSG